MSGKRRRTGTVYVHVPACNETARQLRKIARQVQDEAALAELHYAEPDRFRDELLEAVLELAYRLGWRNQGDDPRASFVSRADALAECLSKYAVQDGTALALLLDEVIRLRAQLAAPPLRAWSPAPSEDQT